MAGEKSEAPTPKKIRDARKKGEVSKSQEIVSIGVLLTAVMALRYLGPALAADLQAMLRESFTNPASQDLTMKAANEMGRDWSTRAALALAPLLGVLAIAGVALNIGQTGFLLTGQKLKPKMSNISPATGFKRIFAMEGLVNMAKAILKMGIVTLVIAFVMRQRMDEITTLGNIALSAAIGRLVSISFDIALWAAIVLFVLTALDYAWQRRKHHKELRMTKHEVRQESKETEGDPQIKGAIRRRRQAMLNRMIAAVPKADVVVTNPTHYAVALRYDPLTMGAPLVVAKGERLLAQRIKEVARQSGVPVLEEPPLARALYASVQVGNPIPANLFHAVAEVLAWVYSLRQGKAGSWRPSTAPQGAV